MEQGLSSLPPNAAADVAEQGLVERVAVALAEQDEFGDDQAARDRNVGYGRRILYGQKEHMGDCTKQTFTCGVCLREEYEASARAAITALLSPPSDRMLRAIGLGMEAGGVRNISIGAAMEVREHMLRAALGKHIGYSPDGPHPDPAGLSQVNLYG